TMNASNPRPQFRGIVHLTLLACAAIFLFPFVWMIATSLKTDEELHVPGIFPSLPTFRAQSPYAREIVKEVKPALVAADRWESALPRLREKAFRAVQAKGISLEQQQSAASRLNSRIVSMLSTSA